MPCAPRVACALAALVVLAASPARASDGRLGIAVLDLETTASVDAAVGETLTALLAQALVEHGAFRVIAQADVRRMIGFEKMKTALTCDLDASCLVDIGHTLGVPLLLAGKVARLDEKLLLSVTLTDVEKPAVIGRELVEGASATALADALALTLGRLVEPVLTSHMGTLVLRTDDEDLEVFVDGVARGRTPIDALRVPPGTHRLEVRREGWRTFVEDVRVPADAAHTVDIALVPLPETHAALVEAALVQTTLGASLATASVVVGVGVGAAAFALGEWFKASLAHPLQGDPLGRAIVSSDTAAPIIISRVVGTAALAVGLALAVPLVAVAVAADWPAPLEEDPS